MQSRKSYYKLVREKMGRSTHVLAIPYPAQGHVIPFMELSKCLTQHGFKVTFVNTEFNLKRVVKAMGDETSFGDGLINLVSIPDGLEPLEDRNDLGKLTESILRVMPGKLKELIDRINASEEENVSCVIADENMGWALEVAEEMKIRRAAFWPASAALLSLILSVPKLEDDEIINSNGTPMKKQMFKLAPGIPAMNPGNFAWACMGDPMTDRIIFDLVVGNNKAVKLAECIICNSAYDLEAGAFTFSPNILPIGPLLARNRLGNTSGYFWKEDSSCLKWLDQQQPNPVVYVAFGSFTVFDQTQFKELALGLELSKRPFLWVVRPDLTSETNAAYPEGFQERIASRGCMVCWAPQDKVLSHPSIACFLSHCGWNSTMEGVSSGVPFLCWPYFADQFLNESYICEEWKVGLRLKRNENGIITREEIKNKVDEVVGNGEFKARATELKMVAMNSVAENGDSSKNFQNFIEWIEM